MSEQKNHQIISSFQTILHCYLSIGCLEKLQLKFLLSPELTQKHLANALRLITLVQHRSYHSWGPSQRDWTGNCAGIYWHSKVREENKRVKKNPKKQVNISRSTQLGKAHICLTDIQIAEKENVPSASWNKEKDKQAVSRTCTRAGSKIMQELSLHLAKHH